MSKKILGGVWREEIEAQCDANGVEKRADGEDDADR